ncbi:MAG TPA: SDR family NAD(P)-dependent oxidoreductase [Solirubrobacteraceae bacterium]|nr:SDR family NAD(P)-dependent oxidoreductase [Solirubrobacteraceae bacterium]
MSAAAAQHRSAASSSLSAQRRQGGVILLGGTSAIGLAIVRALVSREGGRVALVGRQRQPLAAAAQSLQGNPAVEVEIFPGLEGRATGSHRELIEGAAAALGGVATIVLSVGVLGAGGDPLADVAGALDLMAVNAMGCASLALESARYLRGQGHGALIVISSLAAVRPRRANFVYGASKAALDALAQGLADELHGSGVRVLAVRPGFVRSPMTAGMAEAPLACDPEDVARAVLHGLSSGAQTVWAPRKLALLALAMRLLPRPLWRRLRR